MSINAMANSAAARRPDMAPLSTVPTGVIQIARFAAVTPGAEPPPPPPAASAAARDPAPVDTALHLLFGYIPTEILTLYVAVLGVIGKPNEVTGAEWHTFWAFLFATPVVFWLVYVRKLKAAGKPLPLAPKTWPIWEMFAATLAYFVWAFGLPESPFSVHTWYSAGAAGVAVLLVSTALGLLAPIFQKELGT